jgi:competence protein ComEC
LRDDRRGTEGNVMRIIISRNLRIIGTALAVWLALLWSVSAQTMRVHFIDVGQGASTLVEFPCAAIIIDTGGESSREFDSNERLVAYLDEFFNLRPKLKKTFHSIILTHPHPDHTRGVKSVLSRYTILNAVTNGQVTGLGKPGQIALQKKAADSEHADAKQRIGYFAAKVKRIPKKTGKTSRVIDPVDCVEDNVDPKIRVLWGSYDQPPAGWSKSVFDNENQHSVVTRIDFGDSSIMITGDLEEEAIEKFLEHHRGSSILNVDVYQVGHHGSHNATTEELLAALSPEIAVIAMGPSTRKGNTTADQYGHPRKSVIELLNKHVTQTRTAINAQVATGQHKFEAMTITRAIYGTGWDGSFVLEADTAGNWKADTTGQWKKSPAAPAQPGAAQPGAAPGAPDAAGRININTATVEQLMTLPRIGQTRAEAIVAYRRQQPFESVDDLENVPGIGPATVVMLQELVTVGPD